jgi:DNA-binding XRE family transcriptional regulator
MIKMLDELPVLRAKLGISQAELAQYVGISRQTLSNIETKKQTMTWVTFMALLAFFENNKESLSQLSLIGFFEDEDFVNCLTLEKRR